MEKRKTYQVVLDIPTLNGQRDTFTTHPFDHPIQEIPQQDLHGNKESEPQNGDEHECIPEVIIDDVQDERSEQTLLTDDLHESNKFESAKSSRVSSQTESEMLLRPKNGDQQNGRTPALSECMDDFEDCLRLSGTNLLDLIQSSVNSTSNTSIGDLSENKKMEESQNLDETTERDFDHQNGLVLFKNSTRSLHSEAMKNNDAIHTIDADQQTIESGSLLFKGPYSPTTKPNASDEMNSHFPSDTNKRRSKSYLTGCCKRNTINKTSAIVTVVIFCLLFIAITLASIYPKREVTAASPKENATRTGKFVSSDFQKTVTSLLYPNTTDYDYLAVDQNQHNNKTLIGHDDDDYNE